MFVKDPRAAPDNNAAEQAPDGPVIGCKTSFVTASEEGPRLTALIHPVYGALQSWGIKYLARRYDHLNECLRAEQEERRRRI